MAFTLLCVLAEDWSFAWGNALLICFVGLGFDSCLEFKDETMYSFHGSTICNFFLDKVLIVNILVRLCVWIYHFAMIYNGFYLT